MNDLKRKENWEFEEMRFKKRKKENNTNDQGRWMGEPSWISLCCTICLVCLGD